MPWLIKSEPHCFSLNDLRAAGADPWTGVRNYQARNFMRDEMRPLDEVLYYHSSCAIPAVVGTATVHSEAYPDPTALDQTSEYFDARHTAARPVWMLVDMKYASTFKRPVPLSELRTDPLLIGLSVVKRGDRLSIHWVSAGHFAHIVGLSRNPPV